MKESLHEVCTKETPAKDAKHHPDAIVKSREEVQDTWPHYTCPNCGLDTPMPDWNTQNAKAILSDT